MAAKRCLMCSGHFKGRADAKTCSPRCRKRLQQVRFSLTHTERRRRGRANKIIALILLGLFGLFSIVLSGTPQKAQALTAASNLNFQARLLNAAGAVVPDGNYNLEFKIYN